MLLYDSKTIQDRNQRVLLNIAGLLALIAHMESSKDLRNSHFVTLFDIIDCYHTSNPAGIYTVQTANPKLYSNNTIVSLHKNELSIDMIGELIDLFCHLQGSVIDPYLGSMATELASLASLWTRRKLLSK